VPPAKGEWTIEKRRLGTALEAVLPTELETVLETLLETEVVVCVSVSDSLSAMTTELQKSSTTTTAEERSRARGCDFNRALLYMASLYLTGHFLEVAKTNQNPYRCVSRTVRLGLPKNRDEGPLPFSIPLAGT